MQIRLKWSAFLILLAAFGLLAPGRFPARASGGPVTRSLAPSLDAHLRAGPPEKSLPPKARLETAVSEILARHFKPAGPGVAVLVAQHGEIRLTKTYGLADIKTKRPVTAHTLFDLASVSKQFTALAVLMLIEEGQFGLNDPVQKLVPDFKVAKIGRSITVNDLIHHLSGLPDYLDEEWDGSDQEFAELTPETHLEWLNQTRPRRAPGKKFEYNNSGYVMLALIVERVSQMPFSEFLKRRIFIPARMTSTRVSDRLGLSFPALATGYKTVRGRIRRSVSPSVITGDGNVYTTIEDLARWDAALAQGKFSKNLKRIAWANGKLDNGRAIKDDEGYGYAFGWQTDVEPSSIFHTGSWFGTATYFVRYLDTGLTIAVLSNDENAETVQVAEEIEAALEE